MKSVKQAKALFIIIAISHLYHVTRITAFAHCLLLCLTAFSRVHNKIHHTSGNLSRSQDLATLSITWVHPLLCLLVSHAALIMFCAKLVKVLSLTLQQSSLHPARLVPGDKPICWALSQVSSLVHHVFDTSK
jgi:hypothetical protein